MLTAAESQTRQARSTRVHLGEEIATNLVSALPQGHSRRILSSTLEKAKTVREISDEQAVPLSTCYRLSRELVGQGLLVVERIIVSESGKRYCLYRNCFKNIEFAFDFQELSVSAELNKDAEIIAVL
jgi:hypothetical protein